MKLAYIKDEPGLEPGLCYQISPDVRYFPSLIWGDPFVFLFYPALLRADDRMGMYGVCRIPSDSWKSIALLADELDDRLRKNGELPADTLMASSELTPLLANNAGRRRCTQALQLTSFWLRNAIAEHPALTFYGA